MSVLIGLIGIAVIIGWIDDIQFLKSVLPNLIPMKVNTAAAFILISISLLLQQIFPYKHPLTTFIAKFLAIIVLLLGFLTFFEYLFNVDLHIDQLIFPQPRDIPALHPPGRMAPVSAIAFILTGLALTLTGLKYTVTVTQICSFIIGVFGIFIITGFIYHTHTTYQIFPYAYAALHTSINFILISLSIFFMQPDKGIMKLIISQTESSKFVRRLLPVIIILPILLGYLRLLGEYHTLYDRESGVALLTITNIIVIMIAVLYPAIKLMQSDVQRTELENQLRNSYEEIKDLYDFAPCGYHSLNAEGVYVRINQTELNWLGYTREEIIGKIKLTDLLTPASQLVFNKYFPEFMLNKHIENLEYELIRKDKSTFTALLNATAIYDTNGQFLQSRATIQNISALKETIKSSRLLYDELEFAMNTAKFGSWDLNLATQSAQRTLLHDQIFGYSSLLPEWTYGMFLNHVHPDDRQFVNDKFQEAIAKNTTWEFKCRIIRADNKDIRWIWAVGKQFKVDEYSHMIGLVQDITPGMEMEHKLKDASSYNRTLIESSLDPLVTISKDGIITDVNTATELITGLSRDKLIGSDFSSYFTEPDVANKGYKQVFEKGYVKDYPLVIKHVSGKTRFVMYNAVVYKDIDGKIAGVFAAARDITERRLAEETAKKMAMELERSNRELQQFAYIISHDLQEPLRMISSYLELIERRYKNKLDKDADDFINFAIDGALRLKNMIDDLLVYSRVETRGKEFLPVNCERVLEGALSNLQIMIQETKAKITHSQLPTVMADESQLIELFQNLINNAIKFRAAEIPIIDITAQHIGNEWQFSVRDNGIGVDPENKDNIFMIFKRFVGKEYPGTGIGLAVCKRIVERHKGRIWVESELGKGSTFYFTIPDKSSY